jgi:hypothetical protein
VFRSRSRPQVQQFGSKSAAGEHFRADRNCQEAAKYKQRDVRVLHRRQRECDRRRAQVDVPCFASLKIRKDGYGEREREEATEDVVAFKA